MNAETPSEAAAPAAGPQIFPAMAAIMRSVDAIGKNHQSAQQRFKYRGIDDLYNTLNPLLKQHGVFMAAKVLDRAREERVTDRGGKLTFTVVTVEYTFYAPDGSSVTTTVVGEGMDSGDKSTSKAMAIAHKYALLQAFCIPTDDLHLDDPDRDSYQVADEKRAGPASKRAASAQKPEQSRPPISQQEDTAPPVHPETGECSPHTIRVSKEEGAAGFGRQFVAAIQSAESLDEIDAWVKHNQPALQRLADNHEKFYQRIELRLDEERAKHESARPDNKAAATDSFLERATASLRKETTADGVKKRFAAIAATYEVDSISKQDQDAVEAYRDQRLREILEEKETANG